MEVDIINVDPLKHKFLAAHFAVSAIHRQGLLNGANFLPLTVQWMRLSRDCHAMISLLRLQGKGLSCLFYRVDEYLHLRGVQAQKPHVFG